jgi:pyruvate dehydrogenase E1 component alpha subunit
MSAVSTAAAQRSALSPRPVPSRLADEDLASLLLIRRFEQALLDLFADGELSGTTHTCLGQEYVPVALRTLLRDGDFVFSNHRGHGHYLARFDDPEGLLAEITGRHGAVCNGVGGSQHILRDRYLSTGIQGESLPVAAGAALHLKRNEPTGLALAYVGDGTWGEGSVYEALNIAALWELPLLVVVEHNGISQSTPTARNMAGSIAGRAAAFGIDHVRIESVDVDAIRRRLAPRVAAVRLRPQPLVVEFVTHRIGPHSKGDDTRDQHIIDDARGNDWLRHYSDAHADQLRRVDAEQGRRVDAVVAEVLRRSPSAWERS